MLITQCHTFGCHVRCKREHNVNIWLHDIATFNVDYISATFDLQCLVCRRDNPEEWTFVSLIHVGKNIYMRERGYTQFGFMVESLII